MKAVILARGFASRIAEESTVIQIPLIEIRNRPIIWHSIKNYLSYVIKDFIISYRYKSYLTKDYFINYTFLNSNLVLGLLEKIWNKKSLCQKW